MQNLKVQDFSCIKSADIDVARFTVLIGPQASGKSVLSKLIYFFNDLLDLQWSIVEEGVDLAGFKTYVAEQFSLWFPPSAWGKKKFSVYWQAGDVTVKIMRSTYNKKVSDTLRITISDKLSEFYEQSLTAAVKLLNPKSSRVRKDEFELFYKLRQSRRRVLAEAIGDGAYFSNTLFIPAGRAFFTSLGKVFAAFEGNNMLDPVTTIFGRMYASYRDPRFIYVDGEPQENSWTSALYKLLGGKPKRKGDQEFVELEDGRLVPFSALSSGQQELLPLITMLETVIDLRFHGPGRGGDLVFIEEPEAHLFPKSQSAIVELLVQMTRRQRRAPQGQLSLFLTTHSPYVLSKINTLIKAGAVVAAHPERANEVEQVVPSGTWLAPSAVKAYSIDDGEVSSIIDSEGFINSDYLDEISNEIAEEYSTLLNIEFKDED